jgi:dihydrolipoamide dehydrogenase
LLPRLVPLEDEEVSAELAKSFRKRGIKSQVDTKLEKMEKTDNGVVVTGKTSKGEDVRLEAEMLLVAVGRMPFTEALGLEKTKIKVERGFIQVDEYQQTAEKGVYAIGDVVPTPFARAPGVEGRHRRRSSIWPVRIRDRSICAWFRIAPTVIRKLLPLV